MLQINGFEIKLEGTFGDLIKEAARLIHHLAQAIEKEIDSDDATYEEAIKMIISELALLKKFDFTETNVFSEELEIDFLKKLEEYRKAKGDSPEWIEYDSGNPFKKYSKNPIQESLKGFIDPRFSEEIDINEMEVEEKPKKKKKKKGK